MWAASVHASSLSCFSLFTQATSALALSCGVRHSYFSGSTVEVLSRISNIL
jgi:hypothetical protein